MHRNILVSGSRVCTVFLLGILFVPIAAKAQEPAPLGPCRSATLRSHLYSQRPPGSAEYKFEGNCLGIDSDHEYRYTVVATWTPSEPNPVNANASEIFHLYPVHPSAEKFAYDAVLGARCPADPWLNRVTCTPVGNNVSDELRKAWPELAGRNSFPYASIPEEQIAQLSAEYKSANPGAPRAGLPTNALRSERQAAHSHDAVLLNPQPLPPKAGNAAQAQVLPSAAKGLETSIIIVSGEQAKPAPPVVRKTLAPKTGAEIPQAQAAAQH